MTEAPIVLVHVLARNKEATLGLYLEAMYEWDYPKERIVLYIRTNNNSDRTGEMLSDYIARYGDEYRAIVYEGRNIDRPISHQKVHEWDGERLRVLRKLRDKGLSVATEWNCDYYFVSDVDNYVMPHALSELVKLDLPVVAPLLRLASPNDTSDIDIIAAAIQENYSTFDTEIIPSTGDTHHGENSHELDQRYFDILERRTIGVHQVSLVHATYLVRRDVFTVVSYQNGYNGYDYIIFAYNLRFNEIPMYLDNREVYGCLTLTENEDACRRYLEQLKEQHDQ